MSSQQLADEIANSRDVVNLAKMVVENNINLYGRDDQRTIDQIAIFHKLVDKHNLLVDDYNAGRVE